MLPDHPALTIVGFGAFGALAAATLSPHATVTILDPCARARAAAAQAGYRVIDRPEDLVADIVMLAVPVPALEACLTGLAPHLRPGQLIVDVCSIKEEPARLMRERLPDGVDILATHPMFGPQSARLGLAGCQVVLCPIRGTHWRRLAAFLRRRLRLNVIVATPEEHDRQAALTQGLTHLLARAFAALGEPPRIRTRSFTLMAAALALVADDPPNVFAAVTRGNRHVGPLCERLTQRLAELAGAPPPPPEPPRG